MRVLRARVLKVALIVSILGGLYLLTVNTRILGILYVTKKDQLNWF